MDAPSLLVQIQGLFTYSIFSVPDYQRGYAWEARQVKDMLNDIEEMDVNKGHYTGTIVIVKKEDAYKLGEMYTRYDIVDGQQRLATIAILLQCLYEEYLTLGGDTSFEEPPAEIAKIIKDGYIQKGSVNKLKLNKDCNNFFIDTILKENSNTGNHENISQKNLSVAKETTKQYFRDKLDGLQVIDKATFLDSFRMKVTNGLTVNRYIVESDAEAGVIFEVMNDRGKPLSGADKIKNYLIYLAYKIDNESLAETIYSYWGDIFRNLMASRWSTEDDFLRYHWITYANEQHEYDIHRRVKKHIRLKSPQGETIDPEDVYATVRNYVADLKEASDTFKELNDPYSEPHFSDSIISSHKLTGRIRERVDQLRRIGIMAPFYPLLISARKFFASDAESFLELLELLEIFSFRVYTIGNTRAGAGQSMFYNLAHELHNNYSSDNVTKISIKDNVLNRIALAIHYYCPDEHFKSHLASRKFYQDQRSSEIKYFFYELELRKREEKKEKFTLDWGEVVERSSVEHIKPQHPKGLSEYTREELADHENNVHRLGNLTITTWNSKLGNKEFIDKTDFTGKRNLYQDSDLRVQRELTDYSNWGIKEINEREEELIRFAEERWPLPEVVEPSVEGKKGNKAVILGSVKELNALIKKNGLFPMKFHCYQGRAMESAAAILEFSYKGHKLSIYAEYAGSWALVKIVSWKKGDWKALNDLYENHLEKEFGPSPGYEDKNTWSIAYGYELEEIADAQERQGAFLERVKEIALFISSIQDKD